MTVVNVNLADDKAYVLEHLEVANKLKSKAAELRSLEAQVIAKQTVVTEVGTRVLAGLTRQNAAAGAAIGTPLTDIEIERDNPDPGDMILHTHGDAEIYRASIA